MEKSKYHIAVTGLNNTDNPGPGVPVIRGLRESEDFNVKIIGLAYENLEPGIYMPNLVDKTYQIPYPSAGMDALLKRIEYIHSRERLDVIIPNFDAELYTFIQSRERLQKNGIRTYLPTMDQFEERQKANLSHYGKKYGVKVPFTKVISQRHDIEGLKDSFDYPLLVKGKYYDAYLAYSAEQVYSFFHRISAKWGMPVIIQELIRGTEVNVIALGDGLGNTIGAVPMRKQYITDKGKAWGGITIQNDKMMELTRDLIRKTKWRGGMELELIKNKQNELYLIEINPRLPAWVYLAVAAGQNLPEALVKLALGMNPPPFSKYEVGKMFIRYSYDLIGDISQLGSLLIRGEM